MTEPKKVHIIRPHEKLSEYVYERNEKYPVKSYEDLLMSQQDYEALGWRRLRTIQSVPLRENWPFTVSNSIMSFSSGMIGALITNRMARNLSIHRTLSPIPSSGVCFLVVALTHLTTYCYLVLRPMMSDDPMLCSTCLEIRSFALSSFIPPVMGTSIALLSNLSTCLIHKIITLPKFNLRAYQDWKLLFQRHAFKGMARRYYVAYPLVNGFLASMIFLGQNYYWNNHFRKRLQTIENESLSYEQSKSRNKVFAPVQDVFTKITGNKMRPDK